MSDISKLKRGTTIGFVGGLSKETFDACAEYKIDCVELSFNYADFIEKYNFLENAAAYAAMAESAGIEIWSVHLPFGRELDISSSVDKDRNMTVDIHKRIIRAAAGIGIKTIVLHPSSEPIADNERSSRIKQSRENILILSESCQKLSIHLAVENLPRTCLCNKSSEMLELLSGTGTAVCFDTNHSLQEDNVQFLTNILKGGLTVRTLHISDYDFIDERHRLPGDGVVNWRGVMELLEKADYTGPLMYEVSKTPKERETISIEELTRNQYGLANKII